MYTGVGGGGGGGGGGGHSVFIDACWLYSLADCLVGVGVCVCVCLFVCLFVCVCALSTTQKAKWEKAN